MRISLSDGIHRTSRCCSSPEGTKGSKGGPGLGEGVHHFGFVVDDEKATGEKIKKQGGEFFMQLPQVSRRRRRDEVQGHQRHRVRCVRARLAASQRELMRIAAVRERDDRAVIGHAQLRASALTP